MTVVSSAQHNVLNPFCVVLQVCKGKKPAHSLNLAQQMTFGRPTTDDAEVLKMSAAQWKSSVALADWILFNDERLNERGVSAVNVR